MIFMTVMLIPFALATYLVYRNLWKLWSERKERGRKEDFVEEIAFTTFLAIICTAVVGGLLQGILG